jgi:predicted GH43/DUF377 family glycosyl hydrolase
VVCPVDTAGYCKRHNRRHFGHALQIALDPGSEADRFRIAWDGGTTTYQSPSKPLLRSLPIAKQCQYFGERLTKEEVKEKHLAGCRSCSNTIEAFHCKFPGQKKFNDGPYTRGAECMGCTDWVEKPKPTTEISTHEKPAPRTRSSWRELIRFDHHNLSPEVGGMRFNPSIIDSGDGFIFVYRTGWKGSNLYAVRLDRDFKPDGESVLLSVNRNGSGYGREDPRLFRLNGKLHISFTGVVGRHGPTNVLFARINEETLAVEDRFFPRGFKRNSWEKNHSYFDYEGIAHAVYTITPHKILRIEGDQAEYIHETPYPGEWSGGYLRGGAAPVLHNGEWYSFMHGRWDNHRVRLPSQPAHPAHRHVYTMGIYTFSPKPPFQMLRYCPVPIDVAEPDMHDGNYADVIFPGGAVYRNGYWCVAMGVNDRRSEIRFYDAAWIESQLICPAGQ